MEGGGVERKLWIYVQLAGVHGFAREIKKKNFDEEEKFNFFSLYD